MNPKIRFQTINYDKSISNVLASCFAFYFENKKVIVSVDHGFNIKNQMFQ